jgi:glycosyltransferase involved in cell wall biosynthesis
MLPLFSIIVPVYNCEKYLNECIDSVVCQDCESWELILVDDGSTDGSRKICEQYAENDSRVIVLTQVNQGPGEARNSGIKQACGEYLIFLDSDDYLCDSSLNNIKSVISCNSSPDIIVARAVLVSEKGDYVRDYNKQYDNEQIHNHDAVQVASYLLSRKKSSFWSVWNHVFKLSFIKQTEIIFEKGIYAEDLDWTLQVFFKAGKFAVLNIPFYCHREREGKSLSFSSKMELDLFTVIFKWLSKLKDMELTANQYTVLSDAVADIYYCNLWHLWNHSHAERKEIVKMLEEHKYIWKLGISKKCRILGLLCQTIGPSTTALFLNIRHRIKNIL